MCGERVYIYTLTRVRGSARASKLYSHTLSYTLTPLKPPQKSFSRSSFPKLLERFPNELVVMRFLAESLVSGAPAMSTRASSGERLSGLSRMLALCTRSLLDGDGGRGGGNMVWALSSGIVGIVQLETTGAEKLSVMILLS